MRLALLLAISIVVAVDGVDRGRIKYQRQLPFPGQPEAPETPWTRVDVPKVDRRQDSWQDDTETSAVEDLEDTVVVGDVEMPLPDSPNLPRQYYPGWGETANEVPKPIGPSTYPPVQTTNRPQNPQQPSYPQGQKPSFQRPPSQKPQKPSRPPQQPNPPPAFEIPENPEESQPGPTLPPGCLGPRGQYPSANSCANYLNCWDDVVIEQTCPNSLLFNDVTGLCDFEDNVDCGSRPGPTPKPSLPPDTKRCPDLHGRYRSSTNCSEFYVCLSGSPIKFSCPPGLVYNDIVSVCDYLYNVDCQGAATPTPPPPPTHETPTPVTLRPQGGMQPQQTPRPDPTFPPGAYPEPSWLGRTGESESWHQRAGPSQIEAETKPEESQTSGESFSGETTETSTILNPWDVVHTVPEELTKGPCENGSVHRLDEACTSVVICRNKRPQLLQCPQGLTYDRPSDSCRHFAIAKC